MATQNEKILQFFKVFDDTKYSNQLHIPKAFTSYMKGNLPNPAYLRDKFGNTWPIKLAKIESEWYFEDGWTKVARDNSLEHKDILIFQFDGDKIFNFKIIGNNSCDKEGVGSLKLNLDSKELKNDEGKRKATVQESKLSSKCSKKFQSGSGGQEKVAVEVGRKRKALPGWYGLGMIKSGVFAKPENPYFVTNIRPNRLAELYIPVDVMKDFKITLPEKIVLRDPAGRTWPSNLKIWKDGRVFYTGGWASLCKMNLIDFKDKCVCEFLLGQGEPIVQVQIVRSQDTSLSPARQSFSPL